MRKVSFLNRFYKEAKIQEAEPSREIADSYFRKSRKSLSSAKVLLEIGNLEDSVAMAYYAMYHSLLALLFRIGIKCENHAAAIVLLYRVFSIDNSQISKAKSERIDKQYYIDFLISKEETKEAIEAAEEFTAELKDFIDRLNNESISQYHRKAMDVIKK